MNPTTQPSEGAARAARAVLAQPTFREPTETPDAYLKRCVDNVASVIDRETGAGELVEVLSEARVMAHVALALAESWAEASSGGARRHNLQRVGEHKAIIARIDAALSRHASAREKEGKLL